MIKLVGNTWERVGLEEEVSLQLLIRGCRGTRREGLGRGWEFRVWRSPVQKKEDRTAKGTFLKFKDSLRVIRKITQKNMGSFMVWLHLHTFCVKKRKKKIFWKLYKIYMFVYFHCFADRKTSWVERKHWKGWAQVIEVCKEAWVVGALGPVLLERCVINFPRRANRQEWPWIQNNKDTTTQTRAKEYMLVPIHRTHMKA